MEGVGGQGASPPKWPRTWNVTGGGFANAMHVDRDASRSYACWVSKVPGSMSTHTWFFFPMHGVIVEVVHGTWISWDGAQSPHVTPVPCMSYGDDMVCVQYCITKRTADALRLSHAIHGRITQRIMPSHTRPHHALVGRQLFDFLQRGMHVRVRHVPPPPAHVTSRVYVDGVRSMLDGWIV